MNTPRNALISTHASRLGLAVAVHPARAIGEDAVRRHAVRLNGDGDGSGSTRDAVDAAAHSCVACARKPAGAVGRGEHEVAAGGQRQVAGREAAPS